LAVIRVLAAALAATLLLGGPAPARAHSLLLESSPAENATVPPPSAIALRFNNRVEKRLCRVRLVDAGGRVTALPVALDGPLDRLQAEVEPPLAPGRYRLEWQVLSTDGHVVTGSYTFRVAR
jgi:methionine-rich copper-binding protein CopC